VQIRKKVKRQLCEAKSVRTAFYRVAVILVNTKEFQKNTKENNPMTAVCSHSSQEGRINSISSPDWYIFIAFSNDTHISYPDGHI
jgi:hypothetical protein